MKLFCYQGRNIVGRRLIKLFHRPPQFLLSNKEMRGGQPNEDESLDRSGHYRSYLSFVISGKDAAVFTLRGGSSPGIVREYCGFLGD